MTEDARRTSGMSMSFRVFSVMPLNKNVEVPEIERCLKEFEYNKIQISKTLSMLKRKFGVVEMVRRADMHKSGIWKRVAEEYPRAVKPVEAKPTKAVMPLATSVSPSKPVNGKAPPAIDHAVDQLMDAASALVDVVREMAEENKRMKQFIKDSL